LAIVDEEESSESGKNKKRKKKKKKKDKEGTVSLKQIEELLLRNLNRSRVEEKEV